MPTKTKNDSVADTLSQLAANTGILLMTAATTLSLVDVPGQPEKRAVLPSQPSFAFAGNNDQNSDPNPIRREREETGPHYISYNVSQRTPGRHGTH